jgi:adsorption protein B
VGSWAGGIANLPVAHLQWLQFVEYELTLFAVVWFVVGIADELAIDAIWFWLWLTGRVRSRRVPEGLATQPLSGTAAVFIPAWHEAAVIGATVSHALGAWQQSDLRIYVGCYCNDSETIAATMAAAGPDPRVRIVIHGREGPTTKADCLNRLYAALCEDEARLGRTARCVILHDAEDMVHPAALAAMDGALEHVDFVQLPVRPEPQADSPWVAGHYSDEFTESHAKAMVVRDALGAAIPAAGVGCALSRPILTDLVAARSGEGLDVGPFAADCLTRIMKLAGWWRGRGGEGASCAYGMSVEHWLQHAATFPRRWAMRCARNPVGFTGSPFKAGIDWGGGGGLPTCGWPCVTVAGRWSRWCWPLVMRWS